jgi:hypothetical protein
MMGAKSKLGTAPEMSSNAEPSQVAATATPEPGHIDMSSAMAQNHRPTKSSSQLVGRRLKLLGITTIYIYIYNVYIYIYTVYNHEKNAVVKICKTTIHFAPRTT